MKILTKFQHPPPKFRPTEYATGRGYYIWGFTLSYTLSCENHTPAVSKVMAPLNLFCKLEKLNMTVLYNCIPQAAHTCSTCAITCTKISMILPKVCNLLQIFKIVDQFGHTPVSLPPRAKKKVFDMIDFPLNVRWPFLHLIFCQEPREMWWSLRAFETQPRTRMTCTHYTARWSADGTHLRTW